MNKIIVCLLFGFVLFSIQCEPKNVWEKTVEFIVKNETEKIFYVDIRPSPYYAYYSDTLRGYITPFSVFKDAFFSGKTTRTSFSGTFTADIFLYNLSDTTVVSESPFGGDYLISHYKFLSPYTSYESKFSLEETFSIQTNILQITDSLVQSMPKDTTMLEKFKDYYSSPH